MLCARAAKDTIAQVAVPSTATAVLAVSWQRLPHQHVGCVQVIRLNRVSLRRHHSPLLPPAPLLPPSSGDDWRVRAARTRQTPPDWQFWR